ncbi:MAG: hypothetical protein SPE66_06190 [Bilifractor sp.]|nr:hypothetical protein [Bilifractor sp.]
MTEEKKSSSIKRITIKMDEEMKSDEDSLRNVGYCVLKGLYRDMELSKFWKLMTRDMDIQYDADKIFQMLVYSRKQALKKNTRSYWMKTSCSSPWMW